MLEYAGQSIAVFGLGRAGNATINYLVKRGAQVFVWDDDAKKRDMAALAMGKNGTVCAPQDFPWQRIDFLVLSPGIPYFPTPHPVVELAQKNDCPIIGDVELLYREHPYVKFIGITGTNGKSTTTALIGHILSCCDVEHQLGGNIGIPVLDLPPVSKQGYYVIEVSSYQLDLLDDTCFNIAILLNIAPDHLDRHGNMEGYIAAKMRIFRHQSQQDIAVISVDDPYCCALYQQLIKDSIPGTIIPISVEKVVDQGIGVMHNTLIDRRGDSEKHIPFSPLERLPGRHNMQNIIAAYACSTHILPWHHERIIDAIRTFSGLRHRMQYVAKKNQVVFVNDSKATNSEATGYALASYKDIYWIVGGVPKATGIESLHDKFSHIRKAYLIGQSTQAFAVTLAKHGVAYECCGTLEKAFTNASQEAFRHSSKQSVVLLSPACASFDQWRDFEARGDAFCRLVDLL